MTGRGTPIFEQSPLAIFLRPLHRFAALSSTNLSAANFHCQQRIAPPPGTDSLQWS